MNSQRRVLRASLALALAALLAPAAPALAGANLIINNVDPPGVGFNDPTPRAPEGGNVGTTVGEQRLIAYRFALDLWGARLDSTVDIVVQGSFAGLPCNANSGVLAQAGALQIFANFPNAPLAQTWFGVALANSLAGFDLTPGPPDPGPLAPPFADDIIANFNGNVGRANCLAGPGWYYGLDHNPPPGAIDFLNTFMHEVAHGLGFQNFMNETTGTTPLGLSDIYMTFSFDNSAALTHAAMTPVERIASSINTGNVVWIGNAVTTEAPDVLSDREYLAITFPPSIERELAFGTASFGPAATPANFVGDVALVDDGAGSSTSDGCEPLVNGAEVFGRVALVDRGSCAFVVKALNAQAAGATAVMIANNAGGAIGLGGSSAAVTVPTVGIGQADGAAIKGELGGSVVSVALLVDPTQLAGADELGRVRLNAPNPVQPGSSISHYDPLAVPNLLMEPSITSTLTSNVDVDLTDDLFADIGWGVDFDPDLPTLGEGCQATPATPTVEVLGCDTGVANTTVAGVCRLSDVMARVVAACAAASGNHGDFSSCMALRTNDLRQTGVVSVADQGRIESCAAQADVP